VQGNEEEAVQGNEVDVLKSAAENQLNDFRLLEGYRCLAFNYLVEFLDSLETFCIRGGRGLGFYSLVEFLSNYSRCREALISRDFLTSIGFLTSLFDELE